VSHGRSSPRQDRSLFRLEHDWTGTFDPAPFLCIPEALRFLDGLLPGGTGAWMEHNRAAALSARRRLCAALGIDPPCPDEMIGAMASLPLPPAIADASHPDAPSGPFDPVQEILFSRFHIEIPVFPFPALPRKILRISTPAYVTPADVDVLVAALSTLAANAANH
jgi:isopenicillin-N epimerase